MLTKIIINVSFAIALLITTTYGQTLSVKIDSLVISSLPFNLSPGLFPRYPEEIRGRRKIVIKDYTSISEFLKYVEPDMNSIENMDVYFNPYVIVDVYFGNSFFTISMDKDYLLKYENRSVIFINSKLHTWLVRRIYPNGI